MATGNMVENVIEHGAHQVGQVIWRAPVPTRLIALTTLVERANNAIPTRRNAMTYLFGANECADNDLSVNRLSLTASPSAFSSSSRAKLKW